MSRTFQIVVLLTTLFTLTSPAIAADEPDDEFLFRLKYELGKKIKAMNDASQSSPEKAEAEKTEAEKAAAKRAKDEKDRAEGLMTLLENLLAGQRAEQRLSGSVSVGFNGDNTSRDSTDRYKLNTSVKLELGGYPRQLRVNAGTQIQLKGSEFEEDVTEITVNYDYYFRPWLESYGFVQRFNDSFLSIQQRYEVGGGVKLEWVPPVFRWAKKDRGSSPRPHKCDLIGDDWDKIKNWRVAKPTEEERSEFNTLTGMGTPTERYGDCIRQGWFTSNGKKALRVLQSIPTANDADLVEARDDRVRLRGLAEGPAREALRKKHAKLELGMAFSLLAELEKVSLDTKATTTTPTGSTTEDRTFSLNGEQRYRWVVRPSFKYRPNDIIELSSAIYFKLPLGSETEVNGETDLRVDTHARLKYTIKEPIKGAEKSVSIVLDYTRRRDNAPPALDPQIVSDLMMMGTTLDRTVAEDVHESYALKLEVGW